MLLINLTYPLRSLKHLRDGLFRTTFLRQICLFALLIQGLLLSGCMWNQRGQFGLPEADTLYHGQLKIHSDFRLPRRHRLLDELMLLRSDISKRLKITPSDEPINVYLFDDSVHYDVYMRTHHPEFPDRRAFFVKTDTKLSVYAYWGEHVGEDLRHEVTHGYVHSVISNLPLWLDEGLAEFYEVKRGRRGHNWQHIELLMKKLESGSWKPDLTALDELIYPSEMTQLHYAESWLWAHLMLDTEPERLESLQQYISELINHGEAEFLSVSVRKTDPDIEQKLIEHLKKLHSLQN